MSHNNDPIMAGRKRDSNANHGLTVVADGSASRSIAHTRGQLADSPKLKHLLGPKQLRKLREEVHEIRAGVAADLAVKKIKQSGEDQIRSINHDAEFEIQNILSVRNEILGELAVQAKVAGAKLMSQTLINERKSQIDLAQSSCTDEDKAQLSQIFKQLAGIHLEQVSAHGKSMSPGHNMDDLTDVPKDENE